MISRPFCFATTLGKEAFPVPALFYGRAVASVIACKAFKAAGNPT